MKLDIYITVDIRFRQRIQTLCFVCVPLRLFWLSVSMFVKDFNLTAPPKTKKAEQHGECFTDSQARLHDVRPPLPAISVQWLLI